MSHYSVLAVIEPAKVKERGIENAAEIIAEMMAPYQEGSEHPIYNAFIPLEERYKKQYEEEEIERVEMPDGQLVAPWDERFRKPGTFGLGSDTHEIPKDLKRRQVRLNQLFPSFEQFVWEWHGLKERDPVHSIYGVWQNPKGHWDWYTIGGRWRGFMPCRPDSVDYYKSLHLNGVEHEEDDAPALAPYAPLVLYRRDLDEETIRQKMDLYRVQFMEECRNAVAKANPPGFDLIRTVIDLGLMEDAKEKAIDPEEARKILLGRLAELTIEKLRSPAYSWKWIWETFAILDKNGWKQVGSMGWFGCSSESLEERKKWATDYQEYLAKIPSDAVIAVVDCHT